MRSASSTPSVLPIFPLSGALLLPGGRLPLNIFEPRYIAMVDDALAGDQLIGMIQPVEVEGLGPTPPVFRTGCAGRIVAYAEDGPRYQITLQGISRFDVIDDHVSERHYRVARVDWTPYSGDLSHDRASFDRPRLLAGLKAYFTKHDLSADWSAIEAVPNDRLVTTIAMVCPFSITEKQTLLQARDTEERAKVLIGAFEMSLRASQSEVRH